MTRFNMFQQKTQSTMLRKHALRTAAVAAVLLAGSCAAPTNDGNVFADGVRNHPITVAPHYQTVRVAFADPAAGLSPEDRAQLSIFVDDYLARGDGAISISAPNGPNSSAALAYLGDHLVRSGVPRSRILVGTHDAGNGDARVEIGYIAYSARSDACGNWSEDASDTASNLPLPDFGCSVQHNVAAMVADPRDVVAPRGMDPADATRRQAVVGTYEKAQPTASQKSTDQSATSAASAAAAVTNQLELSMSQAMAIGKAGNGDEPFGAAPHERPVPRISISAFCEFPDSGAALQRAAADRRLAKAHVDVQLGGVQAAIDHFTGQITPNLLIVETKMQGNAALEDVDRLAEVCDPATKVLVIGRVNDVELYRDLMRRGVSEYLVAPLNPLHLIETISGLYVDRETQPVGRVVAFVSARGGAGSSTLAHNVGWCVAEQLKIYTTIIDFDLPFGTLALDFNEEPTQSVADALGAPERLDDVFLDRVLIKVSDRLSLFASPTLLERGYDADPAGYEAVIDAVRQMSPCVIVDVPHVWSPWVRQTLLAADDVVIVAAPCLGSLRNGKAFVDLLKQNRPNDAPPRLVINQVGVPKRPEIPVKEFASAIGIEPAVTVPFEPQLFGASANHGQMLVQMHPRSHAAEGIARLAEIVTGRRPQENSQKGVLPFLSFLKMRKSA